MGVVKQSSKCVASSKKTGRVTRDKEKGERGKWAG